MVKKFCFGDQPGKQYKITYEQQVFQAVVFLSSQNKNY